MNFIYLSHMPFEDMLATVSNVPPGSIVLLLVLCQDVKGKVHNPDSGPKIEPGLRGSNLRDCRLRAGIRDCGRQSPHFERIGSKAGELVLDFLRGIHAGRYPAVLNVPPVPMFDWRQLERWNLSEGALPKGSIVINREFTLWDFKYYIIGVLAFCLAESALIIFLIVQMRRKNIAEKALRESEERLDLATAAAGTGIWIMNMDAGAVWVTDKLRELFRFDPDEELTFDRFMKVIHPEDREIVRESVMESMKKRESMIVEYRILQPDGAIRWYRPGAFLFPRPGRPMR